VREIEEAGSPKTEAGSPKSGVGSLKSEACLYSAKRREYINEAEFDEQYKYLSV